VTFVTPVFRQQRAQSSSYARLPDVLNFAGSLRTFNCEGIDCAGDALLQVDYGLPVFSRVDCVL